MAENAAGSNETAPAVNGKKTRKARGPSKDQLVILKRAGATVNAWAIQDVSVLGLKKPTAAAVKAAVEKSKIPGEYKIMSQKGKGFMITVEKVEVATAKDVE